MTEFPLGTDGSLRKTNGIASVQTASVSNGRLFMKKIIRLSFIFAVAVLAFATSDSLYEINGAVFNARDKTNGPKALVKVKRHKAKIKPTSANIPVQDSFLVSLKTGAEQWFEMEKNTHYSLCIEGYRGGIWKTKDFSYQRTSDSCIQINSGNYVKSGKIQYATKMGNGYTFHILVGMKYIDLRGKEHLLGEMDNSRIAMPPRIISYNLCGKEHLLGEMDNSRHDKPFPEIIYYDSLRNEEMDEVLAVDKYKVTECEFVQMLWDSIPSQLGREPYEFHPYRDNDLFWINKKKSMIKGGYCNAHDSAAIRIYPYHGFLYANLRSLRDNLKPVYRFETCDDDYCPNRTYFKTAGGFEESAPSFDGKNGRTVLVHIDVNADGYRLPTQDEWMALARAGNWSIDPFESDSSLAAQYAWFGVVEPDDPFEQGWFTSCGERLQKSRPVGMLKPNDFGLYDMFGLVCENVRAQRTLGRKSAIYCKGGFLTDSLKALRFGSYCYNEHGTALKVFQGLRLVRKIK